MLKKRMIFTLIFSDGNFMLSRNFRLQKVGDINWLRKNYNFSLVSNCIDELVVLNASRTIKSIEDFCFNLKLLTEDCFVPIAAGGGIDSVETAKILLRSGADKVVLNSALYTNDEFVNQLSSEIGQQSIIGSIDLKLNQNYDYQVWSNNGFDLQPGLASEWINKISSLPVGELYLNSIDQDGTGQGFDMTILNLLPTNILKPIILAGGVGNSNHLIEGLTDHRISAVATANLFNFIGNGLKEARNSIILSGIDLPNWDTQLLEKYLNRKTTSA